MALSKAFLFSVNDFKFISDLAGCYNDNMTAARNLRDKYNVNGWDIRLLTGSRVTKINVLERLDWLVSDLKAGDRIFLGHSHHGLIFPERDRMSGRPILLSQAAAMWDFNWDDGINTCIRDFEFIERMLRIPEGVIADWVNDSCNSGRMTNDSRKSKGLSIRTPDGPMYAQERTISPDHWPLDVRWRYETAVASGLPQKDKVVEMIRGGQLNVAYWAGSAADKSSLDLHDPQTGKAYGAHTEYLFRTLAAYPPSTPRSEINKRHNDTLYSMNMDQNPQLEAPDRLLKTGFQMA